MAFLIDQLISGAVTRPDVALPIPDSMPAPDRPRDLFGLMANLGPYASRETVHRHVSYMHATQHGLTYAVLGRMPRLDELTDKPANAGMLSRLIFSAEFRGSFAQRVLETYPDRRRNFWLEIPGHRHGAMLAEIKAKLPLMPHITGEEANQAARASDLREMCIYLRELRGARETLIRAGRQHTLLYPSPPTATTIQDSWLGWPLRSPALRGDDAVVTVLDEPLQAGLRQLAEILDGILAPEPAPQWQELRRSLKIGEKTDRGELIAKSAALIDAAMPANPICHALGDGSCDGAIGACAEARTEIADARGLHRWFPSRWDLDPPAAPATVTLSESDLPPPAAAALRARLDQDFRFYERFQTRLAESEWVALHGLVLR